MIYLAEPLKYKVTTAGKIEIGDKILQFVQDRVVQIKITAQSNEHIIFEYTLLENKVEGTADIHQWAAEMEWLQSPLYFVTDAKGKLKALQGLDNIKERWYGGFRNKIFERFKDKAGIQEMLAHTDATLNDTGKLAETFMGYSQFRALFENICGNVSTPEEEWELNIKNFFGKINLPLIIKDDVEQVDHLVTRIIYNGTLNHEAFDRKGFVRMMKDLTKTYDLKVDMEVEQEEIYTIKNSFMQTADLFLECYVPCFYRVTTAHQAVLI